jgi:uncharacterized protein (TIGR03435 family)
MKTKWFAATSLLALAAGALAQTPAAGPSFEVVSIKPVDMPTQAQILSGKLHAGMKIDAARVDIGLTTVMDLICKAYEVKPYQVQGPSWINSQMTAQHFDVMAKMPPGSSKDQVPAMLQTMLAERFGVVIHKEKKEQAVYALVVGKGGPKLKESEPLPAAPPPEAGGPTAASSGSSEVSIKPMAGGAITSDGETQQKATVTPDGKIRLEIQRATITKLTDGLIPLVDKPIVDLTELKGRYDMTLELSMQEMMAAARKMGAPVGPAPGGAAAGGDSGRPADAAGDSNGSGVFLAVQALGLKLEPRKLPLDLIVVDKAEKMPSDN